MNFILSHNNLDFDALASMIAAKKLYPNATPVLPSRITSEVEHFITIYKNVFPFVKANECDWSKAEKIILVDTSFLDHQLPESLKDLPLIIHDHHELEEIPDVEFYECEPVGATITLLSERIQKEKIEITPLEATVFSLGIYSDTDSFTLSTTTSRDLEAGAFFLRNGANLKVVDQFREVPLTSDQQQLFQQMLEHGEVKIINGLEIMLCLHEQEHYTGHLAHITRKLLQISGVDGVISLVRMGNKTFVTSRAQSEQIDYRPIMAELGGGGHPQAASASMKNTPISEVKSFIEKELPRSVVPAQRASDLMSTPVRVIAPETAVDTASKMLYRYGHSGFPVVENEELIGVISRRDIDKAIHHGLGHAPVKGFMQRNPLWIEENAHLETIRNIMMDNQVGRLPVMKDGKIIGLVSRTDIIQAMHGAPAAEKTILNGRPVKRQVTKTMQHTLAAEVLYLLELVKRNVDKRGTRAYLIGGIVRDMFLHIPNKDIDIVVEGDAIDLAEELQKSYGGRVKAHEAFRTATWTHPDGEKVDLSSARTEYYDFPAALPQVEPSSLKEDLYRRDFTVNALAVSINEKTFGELTDYFNGLDDIYAKKLKILYNLSFVEDPTRILRAVRFETRFNFRMAPQTKYLAEENQHLLRSVSHKRLSDELSRLFTHSDPRKGAQRLLNFNIERELLQYSAPHQVINKRIRQLYAYEKLFKSLSYGERQWISYWMQFASRNKTNLSDILPFAMNKNEEKTVYIWTGWLETNAPERWKNKSIKELHIELHAYSVNAITAFTVAFTDQKLRWSIMKYLYRRCRITDWVTGKDLIKAGRSPDKSFSAILFEAELIKLSNPALSTEEIIQKVFNSTP
ncbi:CBS domain-containing protein [Alkalicoccus daliensis]|uniref:tRNA nucleotidyltransferase (CCA-adding enzyme) n=1 Tax=Alkalicoccus daliensis TaxID=745820 RepID=A0A1H0BHL8_9BACI|nr:CBS domain-containing protein [Alkalicoccus daliensis]SDN44913.1 tRNA nucleotidyltransferase (CCA-adding enzyme) [Alkalicoccus daliensis]